MSLKTSFCNKSIIKSDFKRLWWIPALHTLAIFLTTVYMFIENFYNRINFVPEVGKFIHSELYYHSSPFFVLALIVPVLLGVFLFSYLQSGKPSTFQHSVPVLRKTHYISHLISGVIMFMIPIIINGGILFAMHFNSSFAAAFKLSHLFMVLGITTIYSFIAFAGSVFVSTFTANVVSSIIFTYVFAVLPILCEAFISYFLSTQLFGYPLDGVYLLENLYFTPADLLIGKNIALYIAITIAFIVAGYFIYKARNLENHSEVVAFPALRPVFVYGAGICCGCIGFSYFNAIWHIKSALALIPLGVLGIVIATMIVKKSFRVLSVYKPVLIYSAAILLLFAALHFDITGYETRVPLPDKIEGVNLDFGINYIDVYYSSGGERTLPDEPFKPYVTDKAVITNITALHTDLVNNRDNSNGRRIQLEYTLKNGRKLKRTYIADFQKNAELFEPICESEVGRRIYFPILRENKRDITEIELQHDGFPNGMKEFSLATNIYDELITALRTDLANVDYSIFGGRTQTIVRLSVHYTEPSHYENGRGVPTNLLPEKIETYYIRKSYSNTIAVLEKYGMWTPFPTADDISQIGVNDYYLRKTRAASGVTVEVRRSIDNIDYDLVIDNPEQIEEVFNYTDNLFWINNFDLALTFYLKNGASYSTEIDIKDPNIPQCLKTFLND